MTERLLAVPNGYDPRLQAIVARGFSLSLQIKKPTDADRIFRELARDGRIVMPLEKTFWAARFGMLVDRFGIPWLINCEGSDQPLEAVNPLWRQD